MVKCDECNGSGMIWFSHEKHDSYESSSCLVCGGKGKLERDEKDDAGRFEVESSQAIGTTAGR